MRELEGPQISQCGRGEEGRTWGRGGDVGGIFPKFSALV